MTTPLAQAVALIREGNIPSARMILIEILKQNPRDEKAWLCLSLCVTEVEQKRYCFEKALKIDPQNQHALERLRRLNDSAAPATQPEVEQQPIKQSILRFSILTLGILITGLALVLICVYVWFFVPPGP